MANRVDLVQRLKDARTNAQNGSIPLRRSDGTLYKILAQCLEICEDVIRDRQENELREALQVSVDERNPEIWGTGRQNSNNGRGRRYAEMRSDAFILVCRYVLADRDGRNSYYRYSATLREAARRQIHSSQLVKWLTDNGGVRALYLTRPGTASLMERRTLHLNGSVKFSATEPFSITLCYDGMGFFNILPS